MPTAGAISVSCFHEFLCFSGRRLGAACLSLGTLLLEASRYTEFPDS